LDAIVYNSFRIHSGLIHYQFSVIQYRSVLSSGATFIVAVN